MDRIVEDWWEWACRYKGGRDTTLDELKKISRTENDQPQEISTGTRATLQARGCQAERLTPADAGRWLSSLLNEDAARRACAVAVGQKGANERREPVPQRFRIGRRVYKAKKSGTILRDAQGTRVADPGVLEEMLWSSKSQLWPSTPDCPGNAHAIIAQYALG